MRWQHARGSQEAHFRSGSGPFSRGADALVPLGLLPAMAARENLHIRGEVSAKLARNVEAIQDLLHAFDSNLKKVAVTFDETSARETAARGSAAFFSGGVDSFYTALKNREQLSALIFVRGFDIDSSRTELFDVVIPPLRDASESLGLALVEVETNIRDVFDGFVDWTYFGHGAVQAALGLALEPQFGRILLAGPYSYRHLTIIGSHPMLDPMWSSDQVEIVHDGAEMPRVGKIRAIADSQTAQRALRVCYYNTPSVMYNCGQCFKCIMTAAILQSLGLEESFKSFPRRIDPAEVLGIDTSDPIVRARYEDILRDLPDDDRSLALRMVLEEAVWQGAGRRHQERIGEYHPLPLSLLERWPKQGRVDLKDATAVVRSPAEAWAYAARLALPEQFRAEHADSSAFLRIRMRVRTGRMGIGVTSMSGERFLSRAEVKASDEARYFYVSIPRLGDMGDVVVQNWNRPVEGEAEITAIELQVVEPVGDLGESLARLAASSQPSLVRRLTSILPARQRQR